MAKVLGSWSGMRTYLEQDMLADSLKGRVRYGCTTYIGMDGCHIFELCIDKQQIKRFSLETVNSYFIEKGYKSMLHPGDARDYWDDFPALVDQYSVNERTEYTDDEFCDALQQYRHQDIQDSIRSSHPLVVMFALLDRRVGKRTLASIRDDMAKRPLWLQRLYQLRVDAEYTSV